MTNAFFWFSHVLTLREWDVVYICRLGCVCVSLSQPQSAGGWGLETSAWSICVFCLQWHLRGLECHTVCVCVCSGGGQNVENSSNSVFIQVLPPCRCSPHQAASHLILFTARSLSTASNQDSTSGRTLQHKTDISQTYQVLDCPCNLHFMST